MIECDIWITYGFRLSYVKHIAVIFNFYMCYCIAYVYLIRG